MKVGIIGITGYTGQELIKILDTHPGFELVELGARLTETTPVGEVLPAFRHMDYKITPIKAPSDIPLAAEAYFLALPHSTAMEYAHYLTEKDKIVIDLSADFRFPDTALYKKHYGVHHFPELNDRAVYGLPELFRDKIKQSRLVANPGCYPTGIILGAYPLTRRGLVDSLIADSKSGVSGAGHHPKAANVFCAVNENLKAYKINEHRHQPEIKTILNTVSPQAIERCLFSPHLVPMNRGIFSTLYISLNQPASLQDVQEMYTEDYKNEPFIRLVSRDQDVETRSVAHTNFCDIKILANEWTVIILTAIDNLGKGAATQAVHNLNIIASIPETTGLL